MKDAVTPDSHPDFDAQMEVARQVMRRWRTVLANLADSPDAAVLTPLDPLVAEQLSVGRDVMHRYSNTLRTLAK